MRNNLISSSIIVLISLILLEITLRIVSVEKKSGYEYLFGKPHRYLLPFSPEYEFRDTASINKYNIYDPKLGWSIGKTGSIEPLYYSDKYGIRCIKNDQKVNKMRPNEYDMIFLGDSFTHGDAVLYEETWTALIEEKTNKSVLNLGVGGYGIDQAALRYINSEWKGDTVVLGLIAGDMERSLSSVYNFYNGGLKTKPKFKFVPTSISIINQPAVVNELLKKEIVNYRNSVVFSEVPGFKTLIFDKNLFTNSYIYRSIISTIHQFKNRHEPVYRTLDERFNYCIQIIQNLENKCRERGAVLVVLFLENNNTFGDRPQIDDPWKQIRNELNHKNIIVWDITGEMFKAYKEDPHNIIHPIEGVHYSVVGNSYIAGLIINKYL